MNIKNVLLVFFSCMSMAAMSSDAGKINTKSWVDNLKNSSDRIIEGTSFKQVDELRIQKVQERIEYYSERYRNLAMLFEDKKNTIDRNEKAWLKDTFAIVLNFLQGEKIKLNSFEQVYRDRYGNNI